MALPMDKSVPESACNPPHVPRGLKWLLAVHLVLSLTPVVPLLEVGRTDNWLRFARDLALGIPVAQVLLLILWVGMGTSRLRTRLLGGLLGNALRGFMAILSFLLARASGSFSSVDWDYLRWAGLWQLMGSLSYPMESSFRDYPESYLWGSLWILFLAGLCRLVWGRFAEIRYLPSPEKTLPHASFRLSIRHLLAVTTVVAFLLGLACSVRPPIPGPRLVDCLTFLRIGVPLASAYAMWAVLGLGRLRWQIPLVTLVTIVLVGTDMLLFLDMGEEGILFDEFVDKFIKSLDFPFTTMATVVGSLLVVRWCGYRLIPKRSGR